MVGGTGEAGDGTTPARARAVSDALEAARRGDQEALSRLFTEVYDELHELAHLQRRRWSGNDTLDTTALLHESYLRLVDRDRFDWRDIGHFFAVACKAMRHILIDYARGKQAQKRGGDRERVPLGDAPAEAGDDHEAVIALCEGLERLAAPIRARPASSSCASSSASAWRRPPSCSASRPRQ